MKKNLLSLLIIGFITGISYAQGPGGIDLSKVDIWLTPSSIVDDGSNNVTGWTDISGNGNDIADHGIASRRPTLVNDGSIQSNVVEFDATGANSGGSTNYDYLGVSGGVNYTLKTAVVVYKYDNTLKPPTTSYRFGQFLGDYNGNAHFCLDARSAASRYSVDGRSGGSGLASRNGERYNNSSSNDPTTPTARVEDQFQIVMVELDAGVSLTTNLINNIQHPTSSNPFSFGGQIAEVIVFNTDLSESVEKLRVNNYLGNKYGIGLIPNTDNSLYTDLVYNENLTFIGNHLGIDYDTIVGNGGAVYLEKSSGTFNTNERIFIAHDGTAHGISNADVTGISRWKRIFKVLHSNASGSGTVDISFGTQDAGLGNNDKEGATIADYELLRRDGTSGSFSVVSTVSASLDPDQNKVTFTLNKADLTSGYYTLGIPGGNVWYSYLVSGNWENPDMWTLDPSGTLYINDAGLTPSGNDEVVILNGKTVTDVTGNKEVTILTVRSGGILDLQDNTGNSFTTINGEGTIRIEDDNFPSFSNISDFASKGKVEFYGSSYTINTDYEFFNVDINLDNSSNEIIFASDLIVNGDLIIESGLMQIGDNSNTSRTIDINGDLFVQSNGEVNVDQTYNGGNVSHILEIAGDFTNEGICVFSDAGGYDPNGSLYDVKVDVRFNSLNSDQKVFLDGTTDFYRIVSDKGVDDNYILDIEASNTSNFNLYGRNNYGSSGETGENQNALGLKSGTVKLNNNIVIPELYTGTNNYDISKATTLWLNNSQVSAPSSARTAVVVYGKVIVSGPLAELKIYMRSGITMRGTSVLEVRDGLVEVNQIRTSSIGDEHKGAYVQSGGLVTVDNNFGGSASGSYYMFDLAEPDNSFRMTGGTLHIKYERHDGGNRGPIFLNCAVTNQEVTGGTVILEVDNTTPASAVARISSVVPFYNLILRNSDDGSQDFRVTGGTSGSPARTITDQALVVKGDLLVESNATLDHNGNELRIFGDFEIENGGDMPDFCDLYMLGAGNANLTFNNQTGNGGNDTQELGDFIIDKGSDTLFLFGGKGLINAANNVIDVNGSAFKLLSGVFDQRFYSIRLDCDTVINYGVCGIYDGNVPDSEIHSRNDFIRFIDSGTPIVLLTSENAQFGRVRWNNGSSLVSLNSDLYIESLQFRFGRLNLGTFNLRMDEFEPDLTGQADFQNCNGCFSVEDMFITAGNESDGGLSLLIPQDGVNTITGTNTFLFPFGIGTTNDDIALGGSSRYTPITVNIADVTGVSEEAYITVRPVNKKLNTMDIDVNSDYLNYYWAVTHDYSGTVPEIDLEMQYYDADVTDDGDGGATDETDFVPGKVLSVSPYTRSSEPATNINTTTNVITFNDGGGFDLENANYTAGVANRYIGSPQIFYSRTNSWANWNSANSWTINADGSNDGINAGFPQAGDIAIIDQQGLSTTGPWIRANIDVEIAELVFQKTGGGWSPRVQVTRRNGIMNFGTVKGEGTIAIEVDNTNTPQFTADTDLGDYVNREESFFNVMLDANNMLASLPNNISVYPTIRIEAFGHNGGTRRLQTSIPITLRRDLRMDRGGTFFVNHDMTVERNVRVAWQANNPNTLEIGDDREVTLTVMGDLRLEDGSGNSLGTINVQNTNQNGYEHIIEVQGDVEIENGRNGSSFDLFNGDAPNNNAILKLTGPDSKVFTNANNNLTPELYKVVVEKESLDSTFTISTFVNINGASNLSDKPIVLNSGKLVLDEPTLDFNFSTGGGDFTIPNGAGLEIRRGEANILGSDLILDGCLQLTGTDGTLDMSSDGLDNDIVYTSSGGSELVIEDGILNLGGQFRRGLLDDVSNIRFTQSGGSSRFGINGYDHSERGVFEIIGANSRYIRSGGTMNIESGNGSASVAALFISNPGTFSESGNSTIVIGGGANAGTTIGINSTEEINTLELSGAGDAPIASMLINTLQVQNLVIGDGATLEGNDLDIFISDSWTNNNGTFNAGPNNIATAFFTGNIGTIEGTTVFNNLTNDCNNRLNLLASTEVTANNVRNETDLYTFDNNFNIIGDLVNNDFIRSDNGFLIFNGSQTQYIQSENGGGQTTTRIDNIRIDNANNVELLEFSGKPLNAYITKSIDLQNGVFVLGDNFTYIYDNTTITGTDFSKNKMMRTNGRTSSRGIRILLSGGSTFNQLIPVGVTGKYAPVEINLTNSGTRQRATNLRAVNEQHPTTASTVLYTQDVLDFFWRISYLAGTDSPISGNLKFYYDQNDVNGDEVNNYGSAKFTGGDWILRVPTGPGPVGSNLDGVNNIIFDTLSTITSNLTIDYTCGDTRTVNPSTPETAFPINVPIFRSTTTGDWNDNTTWLKDGIPSTTRPTIGSRVIIEPEDIVTIDTNSLNIYNLEINGKIEVNNTIKHNLGIVTGNGIMELESGQFPGGSYDDFLTTTGGIVEYTGSGTYTTSATVTAARGLIFSGLGTRVIPALSTTIGDSILIDGVTVDNTVNNSTFDLEGDIAIRNGGTFSSGTGGINFIGDKDSHIKTPMTGANQLAQITVSKTNGRAVYIDDGTVFVKSSIDFERGRIIPGNNKLLMDKNLSFITPPWDSSYVEGIACKELINGETFAFPVGDNFRFAYSQVNSSTAGEWCSRYHNNNPTDDGYTISNIRTETPQIIDVSDKLYWDIEGPTGGQANGGITLNWRLDSNPYPNDIDDAALAEWATTNGGEWYNKGGSYDSIAKELTTTNVVTFSTKQFTFASIGDPLPVEYLSFIVEKENGKVILDWTTLSEKNNDRFEIERSYDIKSFEYIGSVEGNGTSIATNDYSFVDQKPGSGTIYYRLKQIDFNGEYEYSKVVAVQIFNNNEVETKLDFDLVMYPNPMTNGSELTFAFSNFNNVISVVIYDLTGNIVYQNNNVAINAENEFKATLNLPVGLYIVRANSNNESSTQRLIIE